ncbi:MAG TPA: hypothetical protein VEB20_07540 [Azospirillaceae bacterium]|nr:hypothetical protein [Azospirillaceae bacterium]
MSTAPRTVARLALAGALLATPAAADDLFGSVVKQLAPGAAQQIIQQQKPQAGAPAAMAPGAMGLAEATAQPPLKGLGTDAVAVVEEAQGAQGVQFMDYVFPNQSIALGPKGKLTLSWLSGCLTETIQGGTVTVGMDGSQVAGGKRTAKETPGCEAATPVILADASEAGAVANRVTPFSQENWTERTIKSAQPTFKWDKGWGPVTVRVANIDQEPAVTVWQAPPSAAGWVAYPAGGAPPLEAGLPYRVFVLRGEQVLGSAVFSIDPGLDVADSLANRVVPVVQQQ